MPVPELEGLAAIIAVDARGRAYVGHFGFDMYNGESPKDASLVLAEPDGSVRVAAEPGGATGLAALTSRKYVPAKGERLGVLICGGNTSAVDFSR